MSHPPEHPAVSRRPGKVPGVLSCLAMEQLGRGQAQLDRRGYHEGCRGHLVTVWAARVLRSPSPSVYYVTLAP